MKKHANDSQTTPDGDTERPTPADTLENDVGDAPADTGIPPTMSPMYALASELPNAHGIDRDDMGQILTDSWDDEGETWKVSLNGSGLGWHPTLPPFGDTYPSPGIIEVYAGSHLVQLEGEALAVLTPNGGEFLVDDEDDADIWGPAITHALHDRLRELGLGPIPGLDKIADNHTTTTTHDE